MSQNYTILALVIIGVVIGLSVYSIIAQYVPGSINQ